MALLALLAIEVAEGSPIRHHSLIVHRLESLCDLLVEVCLLGLSVSAMGWALLPALAP